MNTFQAMAQSRHFEYLVGGKLVIVRATSEEQALAALRKRYGFGASIEPAQQPTCSPSLSVQAGDHAA